MIILDHRFNTCLLLSTYGLLVWQGHFFLLFLVTALVLIFYFTSTIKQLKSERDFQIEVQNRISEIEKSVRIAQVDAENARQTATDLGSKFGFKSITK